MKTGMIACAAVMVIGSMAFGQMKFDKLSLDKAMEKAKKEGKLVFVDVYAEWCGPCKRLSNSVFPDKNLGDYMNKSFVNIKIDGDADANVDVMMKYEVEAFPTLLFINPATEEVRKVVGFVSAEELKAEAQFAVDPSSNPVNVAKSAYDQNPSEENQKSLITALMGEREQDEEQLKVLTDAYLAKHTTLNFEDEFDFMVFMDYVNEWDDENVQRFVKNRTNYSLEVRQNKFAALIGHYLVKSIESKDLPLLVSKFNLIFPFFADTYEDGTTQEDLLGYLKGIYERYTE
jgi:thioredoxin-related protein